MNRRALVIVVGFELKRMLIGPRGILTFIAMLISLVPTCFWVTRLAEELHEMRGDAVGAALLGPVYSPIAWLTDLPDSEIELLFSDHPPHLLAFFAACLWLLPMLSYITGFDQTATDIRSRYLRFLLLRVDRATLLFARALAVFIVIALGYALTMGLLVVMLSGVEGGIGGAEGLLYILRIWLCVLFFSVPMVALLSWTNALSAHPYMAFALALGMQFTLWVVGLIGSSQELEPLSYVSKLFPTAYKYNLLSDDFSLLQVALVHQLGLALLFAAMAWFAFRRRDL